MPKNPDTKNMWKVDLLKVCLKHEIQVHQAVDFLRSIAKEVLEQYEN